MSGTSSKAASVGGLRSKPTLADLDVDQIDGRTRFHDGSMERIDWTFALSLAATLVLAVGAIYILLFAMYYPESNAPSAPTGYGAPSAIGDPTHQLHCKSNTFILFRLWRLST